MNIKKSLLVSGVVAAVGVSSVGIGVASAAPEFRPDALLGKITGSATAEGDAKGQGRIIMGQHKEQPEQSIEAQIDQLVREGKLTEDQKSKILAKHAELKAQMEAELTMDLSGKTKEQMQAVAEERHKALEVWGQQNGIPAEHLYLALGIVHAKTPSMMVTPSSGTSPAVRTNQ